MQLLVISQIDYTFDKYLFSYRKGDPLYIFCTNEPLRLLIAPHEKWSSHFKRTDAVLAIQIHFEHDWAEPEEHNCFTVYDLR